MEREICQSATDAINRIADQTIDPNFWLKLDEIFLNEKENMENKTDELFNCPFCGGESILVPLASCHGFVACIGKCGFRSGDFWDEPMTEGEKDRTKWNEIATKAWNRRA